MTTSRRDLLIGAGKLFASLAVSSSSLRFLDAMVPPCGAFNIVLHGLFVVQVQDSGLLVVAPDCTRLKPPHTYVAGSWEDRHDHFLPFAKGQYSGQWSNTTKTAPKYSDLPVLIKSKVRKLKPKKAYLRLQLPFPNEITGLRSFLASEIDYPDDWITATKFPLVTMLTYNSVPTSAPIPNTPWDPAKNYHVFAEPEEISDCDNAVTHGHLALRELWKLFEAHPGRDPIPKSIPGCSRGRDSSNECIDPIEEKGLSELNCSTMNTLNQKGFFGVHMPMCAVFATTA